MATTAFLGLWAQTSIHAGAGSSVDGIDLPIQREGHNDWPCVFGSSVKGALRAKAEDLWGKNNDSVRYVFGPDSDSDNASEHAGALMVSDARLLLLSVRSLTSYFKWVTCPALLKRLKNDAQCFDVTLTDFTVPNVEKLESGLQLQAADGDLFLEEYRITTEQVDLSTLVNALSALSGIAEADLNKQLVVVSNELFTYLCRHATPVNAHIAIDNKTKTVKTGALWYEETLPPETVFYVALKADVVRDATAKFDDSSIVKNSHDTAVLESITNNLFAKPFLQIGGNETVGMGWCKVQVNKGA